MKTRVINLVLSLSQPSSLEVKVDTALEVHQLLVENDTVVSKQTNKKPVKSPQIIRLSFTGSRSVRNGKNNSRRLFSFIRMVRILFSLYRF